MKGFSVLLAVLLVVLAQQLAAWLQRNNALPAQSKLEPNEALATGLADTRAVRAGSILNL